MELYDVGMSSLAVAEADALAELLEWACSDDEARAADARALRADASATRAAIAATLWDESRLVFADRFTNGTRSDRVAPTSFYALLARAATDEQAERTVGAWLTNASRFGVRPNDGRADAFPMPNAANHENYWGLPSISADDAAFPPLGYWRGYVWGPMAQLVHWSLEAYDHVPKVREARLALSKQMSAMMMDQWERRRRVCENFSPRANATECTGTGFYTWGALSGLVRLVDAEA